MSYDPDKIEKKWQRIWKKIKLYQVPDRIRGKRNLYCLDMFPYPSGEGLHVGHLHGYIGSDVISRFYRSRGFNVLHPMGFDAFGLPAENAAIKHGIHPRIWTSKNIGVFIKQLSSIGASYDWDRMVVTSRPHYYRWTQWMFLKLYQAGLVYRAEVPANWCPNCKTILANEQVVGGKCERCESQVFQKKIGQWLFKITAFAEDLLSDLVKLDWPENTIMVQKNWIGKSEGWEIKFPLKNSRLAVSHQIKKDIAVFTTRIDTLFGAAYLVVAPEHPIIKEFETQISNFKFVRQYIEEANKKTERERISTVQEKSGIEIKGIVAINPANHREIPIFVADYVLMHYATGAIMAVPAHDQRDFEFARKHNLPMIEVIASQDAPCFPESPNLMQAYEGEGRLINSGRFDGMKSQDARQKIGEWLSREEFAGKKIYYKLRDWIISRQRYWGAPIPMVECRSCGWIPVPEKALPVLLPKITDFLPDQEGRSPLSKSERFMHAVCPKCQGPGRRETDTLDTFVCSAWYYFRYTDPGNDKVFATKGKIKAWLPVDIYVGGAEHAVGHLLYSRFLTKVLKKMGYLNFTEPFLKLVHPGIILAQDHQKMSKSRGNVITPESVISQYGADTLRIYEMFMGPFGETMPWDTRSIAGALRFLQKVWKFFEGIKAENIKLVRGNLNLRKITHQTIKKVTEDIENFRFNTAISSLMILFREISKDSSPSRNDCRKFLLLLAPFAPHLTEELWQGIKRVKPKLKEFQVNDSIHFRSWPRCNPKFAAEAKIRLIIQVNGRVRDGIEAGSGINQKEAEELAFSRENVKRWIEGKEIKRVIFIPNKLLNIVV